MNETKQIENSAKSSATARVETDKGLRYLKALCNHFNRKVEATYNGNLGKVMFPFGECLMEATDEALLIDVTAADAASFVRTKAVVADHLIRFGAKDELTVVWVDTAVS